MRRFTAFHASREGVAVPTRISRWFLIVLAATLAAPWRALPAAAIQDGTIDTRPYRYPNVVCVSSHDASGGDFGCGTGALIAPRVVLTAGHITVDQEIGGWELRVSTAAEVPIDPDTSSMIRVERAVTHPGFFRGDYWKHDIGVLILAEPIRGVPLVQLPEEGLLDDLQAEYGSIDRVPFTGVGYGFQMDDSGNWILDTSQHRRYGPVYVTGGGLPPKWFNLDFSESGIGPGDSGGPVFLGETFTEVATLYARLDTPSARSFLGEFVTLP